MVLRVAAFLLAFTLPVMGAVETPIGTAYSIDTLVVYTPSVLSATPQPNLDAFIKQAITLSNPVFMNNDLPAQLRLVGTYMTTYTELGGDSTALDLLRLATEDGYMDDVLEKRDELGADVVILMTNKSKVPGLAFGMISPEGNPNDAFALVRTDYWLVPYVVLHEVGHILGLSHETGGNSGYPYAYAYRNPSKTFYTVMYGNNPTGTIPYFSSATRQYNGQALGTATADAERVLRQTIPIVANYRVGC